MTKLLIASCALCASAAAGDLDASGLVQHSIKLHGPDATLLARVETSAKMRRVFRNFMFSFASDGRRWSELLFGTPGSPPAPVPVAPADEKIGCSAVDRESFTANVMALQDNFASKMQELLPKIMAGAMESQMSSPFLPMAQNEMTMPPMSLGDLHILPEVCETVVNSSAGNLSWSGLMSCVTEALNVSTSCVECVPYFGVRVQDNCGMMCQESLSNISAGMQETAMAMQDQMESIVAKSGGMAMMPGMADMEKMQAAMQPMADELGSKMNSILMGLVPCGECVGVEATAFAGCVGGDEGKAEANTLVQELLDEIKSGRAVQVQVAGPGNQSREAGTDVPM